MKRLILALVLILAASSAQAQVSGSAFAIVRCWDGSTVFNCGDLGNTSLRVSVVSGGFSAATFGSAFPATGLAIGYSDGTNMVAPRAIDADTGGGTYFVALSNLVRRTAGTPAELIGQSTMALSVPVTMASDQTSLTTQPSLIGAANNDGSAASVTTTSSTLLASFATRRFAALCSAPTNTDTVFVKFGATATTADFPLYVGACFSIPPGTVYTGTIDARSNTGTQTVALVEW